ncbi:MAG TPA: DUF4037 domain-containing protein [Pyrinomonadaceae bacterium]|nr:DUF4037 domain-containing protein [Pyrinomonadaceae bacterium]
MTDFIPGLELCGLFYREAVKPILDESMPGLRYGAALTGSGSEILGFDTEMSADHHWGPRVMLFLAEEDVCRYGEAITEALRHKLPPGFRGYSTNFTPPDPSDKNIQRLEEVESGPINHRVELHTIRGFLLNYLDFDMEESIAPADWLTFPSQKLRTITAGAVYHDEVGLQDALARFGYYPHDVWLYLLASGWTRIGQEEHLMGRAGMVFDEVGSALIGSRLVRDLMHLCFLMEKQYAPYPKWFGTAFSRLKCAEELSPVLKSALAAETWKTRERYLSSAYEYVAGMHNRLGITEPLPSKVANFFGRPFLVIHTGGGHADAIRAQITDAVVQRIAGRKLIGSIDQFSDSTDILSDPQWRTKLRALYE